MTAPKLVDWLSRYDSLVEVGIGPRGGVAATLAGQGCQITATDVQPVQTPPDVRFVIDDITAPREAIYTGAGLIYARRLPAELQRPFVQTATRVGSPAVFTTLGGELPVVETTTHTLAGTTLYLPAGPVSPADSSFHDHG